MCGIVITRLPFRALPEYELRVADVGYIARGRWEQTKDEDYFFGAPDLIIETRRSLSALKMVAASSGWSTHPFAGSRYRRPMASRASIDSSNRFRWCAPKIRR